MFSDPLSVTVDGSSKSLPRIESRKNRTAYKTADGEYEVVITSTPPGRDGAQFSSITLVRRVPDPTPDPFTENRQIVNSFGISYSCDISRYESDDLAMLRTALLALVNSSFEARLVSGEK